MAQCNNLGDLGFVVGSPRGSHQLEKEVFIINKTIGSTFDHLSKIIRSFEFAGGDRMTGMIHHAFHSSLNGLSKSL